MSDIHRSPSATDVGRSPYFPDCACTDFISHPAHARPGIHPFPAKLWVITVLEDPLRWRSRYLNYWDFARSIECQGGVLITVELAQGDRHFEVTSPTNPHHLQLRTRDEMFHKENLGNLGCRLLPLDAQYVAFVDADMISTRPDWMQETLHQLQHFDVVQMFSSYTDLDHRQHPYRTMPSFMWNYWNVTNITPPTPEQWWEGYYYVGRGPHKLPGATGGAWAYRVEALHSLGGLMDRCIIGSADWYMAYGLVQRQDPGPEVTHCTDQYKNFIRAWIQNAAQLRANIGYVDAHLIHKWHGDKAKRQYGTRWQILETNHYDPYIDLRPNAYGVWEWTGNKPRLRDEVRRYLREREEDAVTGVGAMKEDM